MADHQLSSGVLDVDYGESWDPLHLNLIVSHDSKQSAESAVTSVVECPHVQKLIPKRICGWDFVTSEDVADLQQNCHNLMPGGCSARLEEIPGDDDSWMLKVHVSSETEFSACARQIREWLVRMRCLYNAKLLWAAGKESTARLDASADFGCVVCAVRGYLMLMPEKGLAVVEPLKKGVESGGILLRTVNGAPCSNCHEFTTRRSRCANEGRELELVFLQPDMNLTEKDIAKLAPKRKENTKRKSSKENHFPGRAKKSLTNEKVKGRTVQKERKTAQEGPNWYHEFCSKMKPVAQIEFKNGAGLPIQPILGAMWTKHKTIPECGTTCDDKCPCWKRLAELGSDVIRDKKKDQKWSKVFKGRKDSFPVGFMNHFSPKFHDLLQQKYPGEKPNKYISQLVDLWKRHESNRAFGLTCRNNCDCEELWYVLHADDAVKDDGKRKKRKSDPIPKKKKTASTPGETLKRAASKNAMQQKAKKLKSAPRLTDFGDNTKPPPKEAKPNSDKEAPQKKSSVPRTPKTESLRDASLSSEEGEERFTVKFSSEQIRDQPLPYFFCTESAGDITICLVKSAAPGHVEESKIKKGTIVEAAEVEGTRRRVRGHDDLRKFYFESKHLGRDLVLHFVNRKSLLQEEEMIDQLQGYNEEWSEHGKWIGTEDELGWAGGALAMNKQSKYRRNMPHKAVHNSAAINPLEAEIQRGDWKPENLLRPVVRTMPIPIVKGSRSEDRPPKIRFSEKIQRRLYRLESATSEFLIRAGDDRTTPAVIPTAENTPRLAAKQREDHISHLLQENGTLLKVVKLFEERCACEITSDDKLNEFRHLIKDKQDERDFRMKDKLLKIYLNALEVNRNAKALTRWVRVQVVLDEIELQFHQNVNVDGGNAQFMAYVKVSKGGSHQILKSLPFSGDGIVHFPPDPIQFSFNPAMEPLRSFEIEVKKLHFETGQYDKMVGSTELLATDFVEICKELKKQYKLKRLITCHFCHTHGKKGLLAQASVTMNVSCAPDEKLRVENRGPLCHKLNEIMDWVQRFNKDLTKQEQIESVVTVEVPVNNSSLLETAILLGEQKLVSKLIDRGALVSLQSQKLAEDLALIEDSFYKNRRRIAMIINENSTVKGEV